MELAPLGPLSTGSILWRTRKGAFAQTVVCKATFTLSPGRSPLAPRQDPLLEKDTFAGPDPARWLWAPADMVPYKMRADVILVGHAYSPGGQPVRHLRARIVVAGIDKTVEVHVDRLRAPDGRVLEGAPAARLALGWDRAVLAPSNPAGMSMLRPPDAYGRVPVPALGFPDGDARARGEAAAPAGFGGIAPWWPGRVEKLGRYRAAALVPIWQGAALPEDADDALFQAAPPDQQVPRLEAEPAIVLENLSASHPRLETQLVRVTPRASVERGGRPPEPLSLVADTLWIDTDRGVCTLTWRGWIVLAHPEEAGIVRLWTDGAEAPGRGEPAPADRGEKGPAAAGAAAVRSEQGPAEPGAAPVRGKAAWDPRATSAVDPATLLATARALPFGAALPPAQEKASAPAQEKASAPAQERASAGPAAPAGRWDPRGTAAMDPSLGRAAQPLPFSPAGDGTPPLSVPGRGAPVAPRGFDPRETAAVDPAVALTRAGALPFGGAALGEGPPLAMRVVAAPAPPVLAAPAVVAAPPIVAAPAVVAAAPPPFVAPRLLATVPDSSEEASTGEAAARPPERAPFDLPPPAFVGLPSPSTVGDRGETASKEPVPPAFLGTPPEPPAEAEKEPVAVTAAGPIDHRAELERRCRARESLDGADLSGLKLAGIQLEGASLVGALLEGADLSRAVLRGANLTGARMGRANLAKVDLDGATLTGVDAPGADLRGAILSKAKLQDACLRDADLEGADMAEARLEGATLDGSKLARITAAGSAWDRASLVGCAFVEAELRGTSFTDARCARADFSGATLVKASLRAAHCEEASFDGADATGARLADLIAPRASFRRAKLEGAQLRGASLPKACFAEAILRRAVADGADLTEADMSRADMARASLREAAMRGALLEDTNLEGADLRGADLTRARAARAALANARTDGMRTEGAEGL